MQTEEQKKLMMPLVTAVLIFTSGIFSLSAGIEKHQTWRIVISGLSMAITVAMIIIVAVQYRKLKRVPDEK